MLHLVICYHGGGYRENLCICHSIQSGLSRVKGIAPMEVSLGENALRVCFHSGFQCVDMSALRICMVSGGEFMTKHCFTGGNLNPAMPGISNLNMQIYVL